MENAVIHPKFFPEPLRHEIKPKFPYCLIIGNFLPKPYFDIYFALLCLCERIIARKLTEAQSVMNRMFENIFLRSNFR